MKVQIIRPTQLATGMIGDIVEIDPAVGNHLATLGDVVVIEHDRPIQHHPIKKTRNYKPKTEVTDEQVRVPKTKRSSGTVSD